MTQLPHLRSGKPTYQSVGCISPLLCCCNVQARNFSVKVQYVKGKHENELKVGRFVEYRMITTNLR